jgi:very-short-patch-repair endonuclease
MELTNICGVDYLLGTSLCEALKIKNAADALAYVPDNFKIKINNHWYLRPSGALFLIQRGQNITAEEKRSIASQIFGMEIPVILLSRPETEFFSKLCRILDKMGIPYIRQYRVLDYRIDCYIPQYNVAVEFDEMDHKGYSPAQQEIREVNIIEAMSCDFIRLSDKDDDLDNIAIVLKYLFM